MYVYLRPGPVRAAVAALCLAVLLAGAGPMYADSPTHSASYGTFYSPVTAGISFTGKVEHKGFHSLQAALQLTDILDGKTSSPGYCLSYHRNFVIGASELRTGYPLRLYCGPGVKAGYVREKGGRRGTMLGVSAAFGGRVYMLDGFCLTLEWQLSPAFLIHRDSGSEMSSYKYPWTSFWIPRLMISKCL